MFWSKTKPPPLARKCMPTYAYDSSMGRFLVTIKWPTGKTVSKSHPNMAAGFAWIKHYGAVSAPK